jgi:probable rRNA maturation factor
MSELSLRNRQRTRPIDLHLLRCISRALLTGLLRLKHYDLGVHLVAAPEMARLNRQFLNHEGSTDVISFDYTRERTPSRKPKSQTSLHGEIFICIDDALIQARQFQTTWQSELTRYLVHGVLHLRGYDDLRSGPRGVMKREERRLLQELEQRFTLRRLSKTARPAGDTNENQERETASRFPLSKPARKTKVSG